MKFTVNGKELKDSFNHIQKIYDSSVVAKVKSGVGICELTMALEENTFILETSMLGVSIRYTSEGVEGDGSGDIVLDMNTVKDLKFKNKPVTFNVDKRNHLHFAQDRYKGSLVSVESEVSPVEFIYDEDNLISLDKSDLIGGLKGLHFKVCDDISFLPLKLDVNPDSIKMISMDLERTAIFEQEVSLETKPFSILLPLSILYYLVNNIATESISIYIEDLSIYFFVDNGNNWWEISVPLVDVDTEISESMEAVSEILDAVQKQGFDFAFTAECSDVKDALDSVLVLGEDKNSTDVTLEVLKSKSVMFSLKSYKGSSSVEIPISDVSVDNNMSVLLVAKFLKDFINIYPGNEVKIKILGDEIEDDYSSVALVEGVDKYSQ